jgi:hypothetical protein
VKLHALWWLLLTQMASAQVDNLSLSGFGTVGIMLSDSSTYGARTELSQDNGSFNDRIDYKNSSVLGLQLDYVFSDNTNVVFQSVYNSQQHLNLDSTTRLAFARITPTSDWSLRLGRIPMDLFLLTQFRDVGFGYTWAHTPTEVYGLLPFRYQDGADATHYSRLFGVSLTSNIYVGSSVAEIASYDFKTSVELSELYGMSLNLNAHNWSLQWRYSNSVLNVDRSSHTQLINDLTTLSQIEGLWPNSEGTVSFLTNERSKVDYFSLAGQYDWERWSYLAEASIFQPAQNIVSDTISSYVSVIFHDNNVSYYTTYAENHSDGLKVDIQDINQELLAAAPQAPAVYEAVSIALSFYSSNQSTVSLGWRWNISSQLALKFQWDTTQIDKNGASLWLNKNRFSTPKRTINTLFTNVNFIF